MLVVIRYMISIFKCSNSIITYLSIDLGVIEDSRAICENFVAFKKVERLSIFQTNYGVERNTLNFAQSFDWICDNLEIKNIHIGADVLEPKMVQKTNGEFDIKLCARRFEQVPFCGHGLRDIIDIFKILKNKMQIRSPAFKFF